MPSPHLDPVFGPLWGLPYQGNINAYGYNLDIMDSAGIEFPTAGSWGLETEYLEALKKATDAETDQWGMRMHGGTLRVRFVLALGSGGPRQPHVLHERGRDPL